MKPFQKSEYSTCYMPNKTDICIPVDCVGEVGAETPDANLHSDQGMNVIHPLPIVDFINSKRLMELYAYASITKVKQFQV